MAPRISRSSVHGSKPRSTGRRNPKKSQKRALDAFSIASHENPERSKIRRHRLGESDLDSHRSKRQRQEDEEDDEDKEPGDTRRRQQRKSAQDDLNIDEGSDSEGNQWTLGQVDEDDDSDIDSDEAFGESDEERFEGWVFRGSSQNQKKGKPQANKKVVDDDGDIDLDEAEDGGGDEEDDEDDLGEDAIDLATALDQYEESEEEERPKKPKKQQPAFEDSEPSEEEDFAADGASEFSSDEDEDDPDKLAQLKDLISSLPEEEVEQPARARRVDALESATPSEFGIPSKISIDVLKRNITDPERRKSLKLLRDDVKPSKRNDIARKLNAPLPKRQQDKLDRKAAAEKANETLARWVDTMKQNRRAEHLSFPLQRPGDGPSMGEHRLLPTTTVAPSNDLESTIQDILQQSGLSNGKKDEEQFIKWEQLQTQKLPMKEVAKRQARLRMERELLFREEVRAKRIKKIKSKAYRRVHRKERERLQREENDALRADGVDVSEDEREYNDRRRAEERMGAKHRESKWAKGVKKSGKSAWDEDARAGVTEMARRNEELRCRMEGKDVREDDGAASDLSSEEGEDEDEDGDQVTMRQLDQLVKNPFSLDNSKLGSLAFMQKAEAARRARNDEDIERMRRELAGEETPSEDENETSARVGRRKYGPGSKKIVPAIQLRGEFEEPEDRGEEDRVLELVEESQTDAGSGTVNGLSNTSRRSREVRSKSDQKPSAMSNGDASGNSYLSGITADPSENPYLTGAAKQTSEIPKPAKVPKAAKVTVPVAAAPPQKPSLSTPAQAPKAAREKKSKKTKQPQPPDNGVLSSAITSAPDDDGFQTVLGYNDDDNDYEEGQDEADAAALEAHGPTPEALTRSQTLAAVAFAGTQDAESEFQAEKRAAAADEGAKTSITTLPGWGGWVGDGLSTYEQKQRGQKTVTRQAGVRRKDRKDFGLDRVIVSEKKNKKNKRFLAETLPFPFETREQYERSLRLPKGREWTTTRTFQTGNKPRVLVRQGVIAPMEKPMV